MKNETLDVFCQRCGNSKEVSFFQEILDAIIPADANSGLPSLKEIGFEQTVFVDSFYAELFDEIKSFINSKEFIPNECRPDIFKKEKFKYFHELSLRGINAYYTNEEVLSILHLASVPPFPNGNFVPEGDLLLLEPVFLRGNIYREV
jgi:hypothetical protein